MRRLRACYSAAFLFERNVEKTRNNKLITMNLIFRSCCFFLVRCNN